MAVKKAAVKGKTATKVASKAKPAAKKRATAKAVAHPTTVISDTLRKSDVYQMVAEMSELTKKQVSTVFDCFYNIIERSVHKRGAGEFTIPSLCKIKVVRKAATKARKGINPFTGEETTFKAKPARNVVKIRPLKKLKAMVE